MPQIAVRECAVGECEQLCTSQENPQEGGVAVEHLF